MTRETSRELSFSDFVIPLSFACRAVAWRRRVICHSSLSRHRRDNRKTLPIAEYPPTARRGFTILELLVVIAIIIALAGLVLATVGYVQKKGARSRAEAEIAAISAALESYKADNGIYPQSSDTNGLDPTSDADPSSLKYTKASLYLYEQISGDTNGDRIGDAKSYFAFKPAMLLPAPPSTSTVIGIRDPFGNSYGYSTMKASDPTKNGYNPTFDLWSTTGKTTASATDVAQWIKNW
jgi:prepilin-type N-terminal cleavage/methylation domain-containing protein